MINNETDVNSYNNNHTEYTVQRPNDDSYIDILSVFDDENGIYKFCNDMYYGESKNSILGLYTFPYPAETEGSHNYRKNMFYMKRIAKKIIDSYFRKVFTAPPKREIIKDGVVIDNKKGDDKLYSYIDAAGIDSQPLSRIVEKVIEKLHVDFTVFTITDNKKVLSPMEDGSFDDVPYTYIKTILEMHDFELDDFKQLINISFVDKKMNLDGKSDVQTYRYWSGSETYLFYYRGDQKPKNRVIINTDTEQPKPLTFFPVMMFLYKERENVDCLKQFPAFFDVCKAEYTINNKVSQKDKTLSDCNFPILACQDVGNMIKSTTAYIALDTDAKITPTYLSPDPDNFRVSEEDIKNFIFDLYRTYNIKDAVGVEGKRSQSGTALKIEFSDDDEKNKTSSTMADYIDNMHTTMAIKYINENYTSYVEYKKTFTPEDVAEKVTLLETLIVEVLKSDEGLKLAFPHVFRILKPNIEKDEMEKAITAEIEKRNEVNENESILGQNEQVEVD